MTTYTITSATEVRTFPRGTVRGPWRFHVQDAAGAVVFGPVESVDAPTSFETELAPGEYMAMLERNNVSAVATFTVEPLAGVDIEVPVSISIALAA